MKLKLRDISNVIFFICFMLIFRIYLLSDTAKASDLVTVSYEVTYHQSEARGMLSLINEFRTGGSWYWNEDNSTKTTIKAGKLSPLQIDPELEKAAIKRAEEIALYYEHTRPNGEDCFSLSDAWGENIAIGQSDKDEAFIDWREDDEYYNRQGHRRNMLGEEYFSVGIACVEVAGKKCWVQEFGGNKIVQSIGGANNSKQVVHTEIKREFIANTAVFVETDLDDENFTNEGIYKIKIGDILKIKKMTPSVITTSAPNMIVPILGVSIKTGKSEDPEIIELDAEGNVVAKAEGKGQIVYEITYPFGVYEKRLGIEVEKVDLSDEYEINVYVNGKKYEFPRLFYYTGNPIEPKIRVEYKNRILKKDKDYILEFKNNINANTSEDFDDNSPMVIITGKNDYKGKLKVNFVIEPKTIVGSTIISGLSEQIYTGKEICPKITVSMKNGKKLVEGKDYILSYEDNIDVGTATILVSYIGNYTGNDFEYFLINGKEDSKGGRTDISKSNNKSDVNKPANLKPEKTSNNRSVKNKILKYSQYRLETVDGTVLLIIKAKKGVSYKIQYSVNKNMKAGKVIELKSYKNITGKLKKGKVYYIRIGEVKNGKIKWGKINKIG